MKKIVLSLLFLACLVVKSEARNFEIWRTTIIAGAWTDVQLTTAPSYIYKVEVASAQAGSTFRVNGGTWATNKYSTSPLYDTGSVQNFYYPLLHDASGYLYTTVGNSTIIVYWDYLYASPRGQESKGLKLKP